MTISGVARRRDRIRGPVWAWAAALAAVVVLVAGAARAASAGPGPSRLARPVVGGAARQMRPGSLSDAAVQQCFLTSASCTSPNPTVAFTMYSSGDTTGCVFTQDTSWGDRTPDTIVTYVGAVNQTPMATFTHAYEAPGTFQISLTIDVTDNPNKACGGGSSALAFTLPAPPALPCRSSQVTVPASMVPVPHAGPPLGITYGAVPLAFSPGRPTGGEKCAMVPAASTLPIDLKVPTVATPIPLGESDATATLGLFPASSITSAIPNCDFSGLEALTDPSVTPPLADFSRTNNCLLTPTFHASWDVVAKWTVPGVVQMAHNQATDSDAALYSTQPLTYYVDLDTMPLPQGFSGNTIGALVDFIYSTLADDLPVLDRMALVQASTPHLLVTDPFGRAIWLDSKNRTHAFDGAGYAHVGGRSIAWVLEPVPGTYHVQVRGRPGSTFSVHVVDLQFLGHGGAPLVENFAWHGRLDLSGKAAKRFDVDGTALSPALNPHESSTRVKPMALVRFKLADSVIPLGVVTVRWSFGDGDSATGRRAAHGYHRPGRYTPTVTVTDAAGYSATVKLPVIIVRR